MSAQIMKNRILLTALLFLLTACPGTRYVDEFNRRMSFGLQERVGQIIDLSEETPFQWKRMYFYGPYTPLNQIEQGTGFQMSRNLEQK